MKQVSEILRWNEQPKVPSRHVTNIHRHHKKPKDIMLLNKTRTHKSY